MKTIHSRVRCKGFTLIELLTVIAIIGILAAIVIPTVGAVRNAASKAQVRAMFSQWANAFTLYKQEYGYFPTVGTSNKLSTTTDTEQFVRTFTGRNVDGTSLGSTPADVAKLNGNKRRQSFYSFTDNELPPGTNLLTDAFGNTQIGILTDVNGDGVIKGAGTTEAGAPPAVAPASGGSNFTPSKGSATADIPTAGVKSGVIFYSAGRDGGTTNAVMSWK